ncbi:hypothetical protein SETIT_9G293900v2 [Setaria italica]|uniref:Uncharacterized protein n=1 Tax=Setaria italica TaxID=4555 RepID=A0A368SLY3_SETIT|nr:hypothetical protein SETIT_9G293900v2 [Setaria italica]
MAREMECLHRANARLEQLNRDKDNALQHYKVTTELTLGLYRDLGKEIPESVLQRLSAAQAIFSLYNSIHMLATGSSHVGSESDNSSDGHEGKDIAGTQIDNNIGASNNRTGSSV